MPRGEREFKTAPALIRPLSFGQILDRLEADRDKDRRVRPVPRQLDGLIHQPPEPASTQESKARVLQSACDKLGIAPRQLLECCESCEGLHSAAFFGSVLREDFLPDSDVDLLLDCDGSVPLADYKEAFREVLGRPVDVRSVQWLRDHHNPLRRAIIWNSKRTFYERE